MVDGPCSPGHWPQWSGPNELFTQSVWSEVELIKGGTAGRHACQEHGGKGMPCSVQLLLQKAVLSIRDTAYKCSGMLLINFSLRTGIVCCCWSVDNTNASSWESNGTYTYLRLPALSGQSTRALGLFPSSCFRLFSWSWCPPPGLYTWCLLDNLFPYSSDPRHCQVCLTWMEAFAESYTTTTSNFFLRTVQYVL